MVSTAVRNAFRTSRMLDYLKKTELVKQTGHDIHEWPLVILKELVDNSLDACEEAAIEPEIEVTVDAQGIAVTDNGPGLGSDIIKDVLDQSIRVSSREAYVAPDRGAQGNALKTIAAMPFVLTEKTGRVEITACGVRHEICIQVDQIRQEPDIGCQEHVDEFVRCGTSIRVHWPRSNGGPDNRNLQIATDKLLEETWPRRHDAPSSILARSKARFLQIADDYRFLNPHLKLTVVWDGERDEAPAANPQWPKWTPRDATCPLWYTGENFKSLMAKSIAHSPELKVREFLGNFRGLTSTIKQRHVLEQTGLSRCNIEELAPDRKLNDQRIADLLAVTQSQVKPVKPKALGQIGRDAIRARFEAIGCDLETFQYKPVKGECDGRPFVLEVAFAHRPSVDEEGVSRRLVTGVNWSPAINSPFRRPSLEELLAKQRADEDEPVCVLVHLATPRPGFTDFGKSAVAINPAISTEIEKAVVSVTTKWCKLRKAEERHASKAINRRSRLSSKKKTIRDAAFEVMEQAYREASEGFNLAHARQIMYKARGPILLRIGEDEELDSKYFTQTLLPDFMRLNPQTVASWDVVFDARGHLYEPHTDREVPLGTLEVRQYLSGAVLIGRGAASIGTSEMFPTHGPVNRYGGILFIEKEGFLPLFRAARLCERYDLAVMSTKGVSVTASRRLVDKLCSVSSASGVPLLTLHDFDKSGFTILGTLQRSTRRYTFENAINGVDLGLRLEDVKAHSLVSERVVMTGKKTRQTLAKNGATEDEVEFLMRGQRVELNAFSSGAMVRWIEGKLDGLGIKKIVPDAITLENQFRRAVANQYIEGRERQILDEAEAHANDRALPNDLDMRVQQWLSLNPSLPWDAAVARIASQA